MARRVRIGPRRTDRKMATSASPPSAVTEALRAALHRVGQAAERCGGGSGRVRVVAVSKTKPVALIRQLYDAGHRCFGENYVQEIVDKAPQVPDSTCFEALIWPRCCNGSCESIECVGGELKNLNWVSSTVFLFWAELAVTSSKRRTLVAKDDQIHCFSGICL